MKSVQETLLKASNVDIVTPSARPLFRGLNLCLGSEKVAMVGRNGVGKSTLLEVLAGNTPPHRGRVLCQGTSILVRQRTSNPQAQAILKRMAVEHDLYEVEKERLALGLEPYDSLVVSDGWSHGQQRKLALLDAVLQRPDVLLLDEPTEALDAVGRDWLFRLIREWQGGLVVVSHDVALLRLFEHFFVISEAGGRYVQGDFETLERECQQRNEAQEKKYLRNLQTLEEKEWHNARVSRRRARKKNLGRIHEIDRAPSRALLNSKRSYAQESQGRAARIRKQRQASTREWARATRRALDVKLALELPIPTLPPDRGVPVIALNNVSYTCNGRELFSDITLQVGRERVAIQGPNGAGKTTLLRIISGACSPDQGTVKTQLSRVGVITQHATNWMLDDSLVTRLGLVHGVTDLEKIAGLLVAHKFPLSLAQRPLWSLSPGERLRAALLCLFQQAPALECLLLDEPTCSLDFTGYNALHEHLARWPGGLIVASHDQAFLDVIGIKTTITLG